MPSNLVHIGTADIDVSYNGVMSGKRNLRKLHTQYKRGNVSKREIDRLLGYGSHGGKKITQLWENRLGVSS
jgi:hypothetical protein